MTPYIHVSSAPKGTEEKKNRSVLPAFVSHSPFSLDCVFSSFIVKLESFHGSGPERFNLPASPEDIISLSHTLLSTALSVSCRIFG